LPLTAQNLPAQGAVIFQQADQIRRTHGVRFQEMPQGVQRGDFGGRELLVRFFVIFNEAAEQVKIVLLIGCELVAGHGVRDFNDVFIVRTVMDRARHEQAAETCVIFGQPGKFDVCLGRLHDVSFHRSLLCSAWVIKRRVWTICRLKCAGPAAGDGGAAMRVL
jgi:hypothetical protein